MDKKLQPTFVCDHQNHQKCVDDAILNAEALCKKRKQRFTAIRRRVLQLVWKQHKPVGAYEVLAILQQTGPTAPPTVYRALDFLQQLGLVHRIASLNAYVGCAHPGEPHDGQFLICDSCHALAELDVPAITNAIEKSAAASGFAPRRQTVEIMGLCPDCSCRSAN
jgi:Fur family zinc uptake transcriptional regulator